MLFASDAKFTSTLVVERAGGRCYWKSTGEEFRKPCGSFILQAIWRPLTESKSFVALLTTQPSVIFLDRDLKTGKLAKQREFALPSKAVDFVWSLDARYLYIATAKSCFTQVLDAATGRVEDNAVRMLGWQSQIGGMSTWGKHIVVASGNTPLVRLLNAEQNMSKVQVWLCKQAGAVVSKTWHGGGARFVLGSKMDGVTLVDADTLQQCQLVTAEQVQELGGGREILQLECNLTNLFIVFQRGSDKRRNVHWFRIVRLSKTIWAAKLESVLQHENVDAVHFIPTNSTLLLSSRSEGANGGSVAVERL